jgi:protein-tyrosine phosphatase
MIDLHTHLLPDWDDGAKDWEETLAMVRAAEKDGITKIGLTPHLYRLTKYGDDLGLFERRMKDFRLWANRMPIAFFQGAEVYINDQIVENIKKNNLTVNNSSYVFVEFPFDSVMEGVRNLFYRILLEGHIPIISHPERNIVFARRPGLLFDLIRIGALAQVTAKSILGGFGSEARQTAEVFLKHNLVHLIASDAHDSDHRLPLLKRAVEKAMKIVNEEKALGMVTEIPQAILDNQVIPDYGEPLNPQTKRWRFLLA